MRITSVVCNVPVLSQNDSTYHHSVFTTWKWHPFATWTPSFIILVRKLKKIPQNTNGRLAIPALAGLLVFDRVMHRCRVALQMLLWCIWLTCLARECLYSTLCIGLGSVIVSAAPLGRTSNVFIIVLMWHFTHFDYAKRIHLMRIHINRIRHDCLYLFSYCAPA